MRLKVPEELKEFLVQWSELSSAAAGRETDDGDVSRVLILGCNQLALVN